MKNQLFMVKDNVNGSFDFPFVSSNLGTCKRMVKLLIAQNSRAFVENIEDKDIYAVANVDMESGVVEPIIPAFIFHCSQIQDELWQDIANLKARAKNAGLEVNEDGKDKKDRSEEKSA